MTEQEWKLSKDNAQLKMQLAQVQGQLCQLLFDTAQKEAAALGEMYLSSGSEQAPPQSPSDERSRDVLSRVEVSTDPRDSTMGFQFEK